MELTLKFEKTEIRPKSHKILMFFSNKTPNMSAVNVMGVFGIIIFLKFLVVHCILIRNIYREHTETQH